VPAAPGAPPQAAFRRGLGEAGYAEGRNIVIEFRYVEGRNDAILAVVADFLRRDVALIVASGGPQGAREAAKATATVPILFVTGSDPVADGLVQSLNRPGGNVTGVAMMLSSMGGKWLQLLCELVPGAAVIAIVINPNFASTPHDLAQYQIAARALNLRLVILRAKSVDEIGTAFASLEREKVDALLVSPEPFFNSRVQQIVALPRAPACRRSMAYANTPRRADS
jgi:putative ABC transport system substrate-binding protein